MDKFEKKLNSLGEMLKKRSNSDFQLDLRNQLVKKANKLNATEAEKEAKKAAKKKSPRRSWSIPSFLKKGFAPATAGVLVLALGFYILVPGGKLESIQFVDIAEANDYYVMTPLEEDPSGVDSSAGFRLESKGEVKAKDVEDVIEIEPFVGVEVEQDGPNAVLIMPEVEMDAGEVYTLEIDGKELKGSPYPVDYSWAYQVSDEFQVRGTIPGDETSYVATNTGIEVNFNFRGVTAEDFQEYFSIEPYADGFFEITEKTAVFAPYELQDHTIYTVTVGAGMPLAGSENVLTEDYTFQFETGGETRSTTSLSFSEEIFEMSPDEIFATNVYYYDNTYPEEMFVDLEIYRYSTGEDYLAAWNDRAPNWASYAYENTGADTSGLDLVLSSEVQLIEAGYRDILASPDTIPAGYYLVRISANDGWDEAFLQVSNQATFYSITAEDSLIWVNDTITGDPISGAKIELLGTSISGKTNSDGIWTTDDIYDHLDEDQDGQLKITSGSYETYYQISGYEDTSYSENFWSVFETERQVYHPDDKVYYWGFVEGRDEPVPSDLQVRIYDSYYYWGWGGNLDEIGDYYTEYYSQDVTVDDGSAFDGSIDIEKFSPGYYTLFLTDGDKVVTSTNFEVQDFIKPAYEIIIEADEHYLFDGEITTMHVDSRFFEGTPVSYIDLTYTPPVGNTQNFTTDQNGSLSIDYVADPSSSCSKSYCAQFNTKYATFSSTNEEEADIYESEKFTVIRSKVGSHNVEFDHDGFRLQTNYLDIDKIRQTTDTWLTTSDEELYGDIAPNVKIDVDITEYEYVQSKGSEYYDFIDKVVRTSYSYDRVESHYDSLTTYTDENGQLDLTYDFDEDKGYEVNYTIYDYEDNYYSESKTAWAITSSNNFDSNRWMSISGIDYDGYKLGDTVDLTLSDNYYVDGLPTGDSNKYMYIEYQMGMRNYELLDSPDYSFKFDKDMVPNLALVAVHFNGTSYESTDTFYEGEITYDYDEKRLDVELSADEETYEPGAEASITVRVTDDGKGGSAYVNLYLVDEAYYSLFSEAVSDPLDSLYSEVSSGIISNYESHEFAAEADYGKGGCFIEGTDILMSDGTYKNIEDIEIGDKIATRMSEFVGELVEGEVMLTYEHYLPEYILVNGHLGVTEEHTVFFNGMWGVAGDLDTGDVMIDSSGNEVFVESIETIYEPAYVYNFEVAKYHTYFANDLYVHNEKGGGSARDDFKDTALFELVKTDINGYATVDFTLPENITSWRVVAAAVNEDLEGGFGSTNVDVSLPLFVVPVFNTEYLTGDHPIVPIRGYGESLEYGAPIELGVGIEDLDYEVVQDGAAYEQSYFDLGDDFETGEYRIISTVEYGDDFDAMASNVEVFETHLQAEHIWGDYLSEGLDLEGSPEERTKVMFMNGEVGPVYNTLISAVYNDGDRADQAAARYVAADLLNEYFDGDFDAADFPTIFFQNDDGGIGVLNYGDSDLELSAKLASLDPTLWDVSALTLYFYNVLDSADYTVYEKLLSLYGLASMGEPVLSDLNYFVENYDMAIEYKVVAAMAYLEFGAKSEAAEYYLDLVENYSKIAREGYMTITEDGATADDEISWTALCAVMAAEVGSDLADMLWTSVVVNDDPYEEGRTDLIDIEKMLYAKSILELGARPEVSFKLNGETITLEGNDIHNESMTPSDIDAVKFSSVDGEVYVATIYDDYITPDSLDTDSRISISREYYVDGVATTDFNVGDLIKVQFTVSVPNELEGAYTVKDFLPSGLKTSTHTSYGSVSWSSGYRYPYNVEGQELEFGVYCFYDEELAYNRCSNKTFYYYARVINKGSFVSEPAVLQSMKYPTVINLSGGYGEVSIW